MGNPHVAEAVAGVAVKGNGGGVGVDDGAGTRSNEEHDRIMPLEHEAEMSLAPGGGFFGAEPLEGLADERGDGFEKNDGMNGKAFRMRIGQVERAKEPPVVADRNMGEAIIAGDHASESFGRRRGAAQGPRAGAD